MILASIISISISMWLLCNGWESLQKKREIKIQEGKNNSRGFVWGAIMVTVDDLEMNYDTFSYLSILHPGLQIGCV